MKFEDWDLADNKKFPHLEMANLMNQNMDGVVITLEPRKWLRGVEKAVLLHFLWILHLHRMPITIFVIRQLLCLVHDGYLWLEEPIPITTDLIHRISRLPYKGKDLTAIAKKGSDLALAESMKAKYKLEIKKRGYAISSIKDKGVHIATQLLASKVMRKCRVDEVPVPVVALAEQCAEGVQFNSVEFLCKEFFINCRKAQEQGKTALTHLVGSGRTIKG